MEIKRDRYLKQLISYMWDGQVKVITGIRRCGKSFLLNTLFRKYLLSEGVEDGQIISIALDLTRDIRFRNPLELSSYVQSLVSGSDKQFYLFIKPCVCKVNAKHYFYLFKHPLHPLSLRRLSSLRSFLPPL